MCTHFQYSTDFTKWSQLFKQHPDKWYNLSPLSFQFLQMHTHIFMLPVCRHFLQMWFSYSWFFLQTWLIFLPTGKKILTLSLFCPISLNNLKTLTEKRIQNYKSSNMKLTELCRMDAVGFFFSLSRQNITVRNNIVLHFK